MMGAPLPPPAAFPSDQRVLSVNAQQQSVSAPAQLDVSDLLSKLVEQGLISSNKSSSANDGLASGNDVKKEKGKPPGE